MQRITITVPQCYNDGTLVPIDDMEQIDRDILNLFGGYSRHGIAGAWTDDSGKVYRDFSYRYEILTNDSLAYWQLKSYTHDLCTILDQKCILTTCESVQADFVS